MSLVVFEDVSLSFGKKTIVDGLGLRIGNADRIGLIGANGSGKTSILRMIAGEQTPDGGAIRMANNVRVGYLPQDLAVEGGRTLLTFVLESVPGRAHLDEAIQDAERALEKATAAEDTEGTMAAAEKLAELHEEKSHLEMHFTEHHATRILAGLGFLTEDHGRDLGELSGGWKMRAVLAALLFQRPDLLLLDEPTNHLDMPSVTWLGSFLKQYEGAFILICHDREFLNEQIEKVVSFETEGVRQYKGNYEAYKTQRAEELVILENRARNLAKKREKAEKFVERFRAKASKAASVQSRVKMLEKMEVVETPEERKTLRFTFPPSQRAGAQPMMVHHLGKRYGDKTVFSDIDLAVQRGEKVGIIGVNGAGKTTLLRIMAGELEPSDGEVEVGHNVKVGYYAQHHADTLDTSHTILEEIYGHSKDAGVTRVRTLLGAFLFSGDDVDKPVKVLSGGERARVALAKLLVDPGNVMLMDEPTNHLDLESSEALAEALATYDGTLVFVSHNRSFIRRLATKIWNVADGTVEIYPGTLDEYMESVRARYADEERAGDVGSSNGSNGKAEAVQPEPTGDDGRARESTKERKRREAREREIRRKKIGPLEKKVKELEARIATLEAALADQNADLERPEVYQDDGKRFQILAEMQSNQTKLDELTARWMGVQEELEAAEAELAAQ